MDYVKPSVRQNTKKKKKAQKRRKICLPTINLNAAMPRPPAHRFFDCSFQYVKSVFSPLPPRKLHKLNFVKAKFVSLFGPYI